MAYTSQLFVSGAEQMANRETYLTVNGEARLRAELDCLLTVRRREVAESLRQASEVGGTVDNAEHDEAKREMDSVERRIQNLYDLLQNAVTIPDRVLPSGKVEIGSTVTVVDENGMEAKYTIVGSVEADPTKGRISNESPVGKAVLGRQKDEQVEARTPTGSAKFIIVDIG